MGSENKICFLFQSTHPRRVWLLVSQISLPTACFNPHTHEGCDIHPDFHLVGFRGFNPHTHEGCDSTCTLMHIFMLKFQSTHPRRVWLISTDKQFGMAKVSIHTPTKGVTFRRSKSSFVAIRFNPHTHEGCDSYGGNIGIANLKFQSTHPRRVWLCVPYTLIFAINVSIHTPTKGVTILLIHPLAVILFQSTHPRRVWQPCQLHRGAACCVFQSTHPRRVWLSKCFKTVCNRCFNPHTHEGCDISPFSWIFHTLCFNPHTHEGCDITWTDTRPRR